MSSVDWFHGSLPHRPVSEAGQDTGYYDPQGRVSPFVSPPTSINLFQPRISSPDIVDSGRLHPFFQSQQSVGQYGPVIHAGQEQYNDGTGQSFERRQYSARHRQTRFLCEICKNLVETLSYCNVCLENFCDSCWNAERKHKPGYANRDGTPHEKTNHVAAKKIHDCLKPGDVEDSKQQHEEDVHTTWFGLVMEQADELLFEDFGRYSSILAEGVTTLQSRRYPGLVSFVGETGAGKSTLIKLLVELQNETLKDVESPVVGSINENVPTSGDVHMYKDPGTFTTKYPILYADCEGLHGGEREPLGARTKHKHDNKADGKRTHSFQRRLRKIHNSSKRELLWATTPQRRTREFAVSNLYPRLLFTFSDVICFVEKNARKIEETIETLVQWAARALETSSNQPVLPHLIIVLNASESSINSEQWDTARATELHVNISGEDLRKKPGLEPYIRYWEERQRPIRSAMDLLKAYYFTVQVVRVPTAHRPRLVQEQASKLYDTIQRACGESREQKRKLRMLLSSDELLPYLSLAFDHFTRQLSLPFDFVKAASLNSSIPNDLGGSVLRMAISMMQIRPDMKAEAIFTELATFVASCVMLDLVRNKTPGSAEEIFIQNYMNFCDDALDTFNNEHWPCEFTGSAGRCVNVRRGHTSKGHQSANGKVYALGAYQSSFSTEWFLNCWRSLIFRNLEELLRIHSSTVSEENEGGEKLLAFEIHRERVSAPFFRHLGGAENFISHSSCYSCLIQPPEHPLPCGHVVCTPCVQAMGQYLGKTTLSIQLCPIQHDTGRWRDWHLSVKPQEAGVRVLTLDGGGIRGIVELEILRLLDNEFKGLIPLREFFDLIFGTSAGGMIALALGVENMSISDATRKFEEICQKAFTFRTLAKSKLLGRLIAMHNQSKYRTGPLHEALSAAFTDELLFGGPRLVANHMAKVGLIATSAADIRPVVLSNYNRQAGDMTSKPYDFHRPEKPDFELKIWEAARASSAAPTFFKSFTHQPSRREYMDGGILHNNPIQIAESERKLLWPEHGNDLPDIVLSIGSGYSKRKLPDEQIMPMSQKGIITNIRTLKKIAYGTIENSLNAEQAWQNFTEQLSEEAKPRYHRLNVTLPYEDGPPNLDDVKAIHNLKLDVRKAMSTKMDQVREIANQLIASCFFFEQSTPWSRLENGSLKCTGFINSRFPTRSASAHNLGHLLQKFVTDTHVPTFIIEELNHEHAATQVSLYFR